VLVEWGVGVGVFFFWEPLSVYDRELVVGRVEDG
jgi:hypothetical protein